MCPQIRDKTSMMSVIEFDVRSAVLRLEKQEQLRSGASRDEARKVVARRAGLLPGTLERIARNRVKDMRLQVQRRVCSLMAREWEAEIKVLSHELQILQALRASAPDDSIAKVEASLWEARESLGQFRNG